MSQEGWIERIRTDAETRATVRMALQLASIRLKAKARASNSGLHKVDDYDIDNVFSRLVDDLHSPNPHERCDTMGECLALRSARGWDKETWDEWDARIIENRRRAIEAETDPARKAELIAADNLAQAITTIANIATKPSAALVESALHMANAETARVAFASGGGACQVREF